MKLGIMQPYFFPYIGYISLIKHVDEFILLDEVQFIRHGWIERNRILKPIEGWQYFQVPLKKHNRETKIKDVVIDNQQNWKKKILAQIIHYRKKAPYYFQIIDMLNGFFAREYDDIVSLNNFALITVCDYLGICTPIKVFSYINIQLDQINASDEWALNICKSMNADEYWNPPGGIDLFDKSKYQANNIKLFFQKCAIREYDQKRANFEPGLSIIDVMMFNDPIVINQMLDDYELF
jgi:hypothetical protein